MKFLLMSLFILGACSTPVTKTKTEKKAGLFFSRGTSHLMSKSYTKALKNLMEAVRLDPKNSEIHNNLGMAYYFKKDSNSAFKHIRKSLKLNPKNTDARVNYASLLVNLRKYKSAEIQYKKALEDLTYEKSQRVYYSLGVLYEKMGRPSVALKNFRQSLTIDENYCPANYKIARLAYTKKRFNLASKQFYNATKGTCYKNVLAHLYYAKSLAKIGEYKKAQQKLETVLDKFPSSKFYPEAQSTLAQVKKKQSEYGMGLNMATLKDKYNQLNDTKSE